MIETLQTPLEQLRSLMNDHERREVECQNFLHYAHSLLAPPMSNVIQIAKEQIAMAGRSDYFMICEVNEMGLRRKLILWEAKAPQLPLFEVSTRNRLIPSRALVEAENQLLYYFDEYRGNTQFLDRYQIRHANDIKLGGIVIGRDDNLIKPNAGIFITQDEIKQMVASAVRIRDEHFYRDRIRVLTWDRVADVLASSSTIVA